MTVRPISSRWISEMPSSGLPVAGEVPGAPVIGELVPPGPAVLVIR